MSASDDQGEKECPLCMEQLDLDELNFFPCKCGYQICQFCWNRIKEEENGLCPACRQPYPEQPADFKPLSAEELKKIQLERRKREQQRKQKMSENRKHLANLRVVQRNLVLVHGLPPRLADSEILKRLEYFGQFGKIFKIVIGSNNIANNAAATNNAATVPVASSASVYVTYNKEDDAVKAILALNQKQLDGRILRASLGTTKYCSCFLQNKPCQKTDCMYLHEVGDSEASFTKEDMAAKKHEEYERKVCDQIMTRLNLNRATNSPPPQRDVFPATCNDTANVSDAKSRDGSVPPPSTILQSNELSQSPTPSSRHNHTRSNPPPRHRNKQQNQFNNESSKCSTTNSIESVDNIQNAQSQSPEPSILQRSSTLDNSCLSVNENMPDDFTASLSITGLLQSGGFGSSSNFNKGPSVNNGNASDTSSQRIPSPSISLEESSSLPSTATFVPNSREPQTAPIVNWHNSRVLAAIQQQQNQNCSNSLFSHDDDAFYRPKLKHVQHNRDVVSPSPFADFLLNSKADISLNKTLFNGTVNGDFDHLVSASTQQQHENRGFENFVDKLTGHLNHNCKTNEDRSSGDLHKPTKQAEAFGFAGDSLKVRSHNTDWQAAFGFGKTDDDLGFDPFSESSKGLEDLVREEKELYEKQQRREQMFPHHPNFLPHNLRSQHQKQNMPPSLWTVQSKNPHTGGSTSHGFGVESGNSQPGFVSPGLFRSNLSSDLPSNNLLNGGFPGYNGLNAQAAPFIPRHVVPPHHQHPRDSISIKDMQDKFRSFFPEANVKFSSTQFNSPPPLSVAPPTVSGLHPPNGARPSVWPQRMPDPRQTLFSRPPPPLATNGPMCFPQRPPMNLSPTGNDLSFHHHPRLNGPPSTQFPNGPNPSVFSEFPGWSARGLAPTPPPGFAPAHQNSS